MKVEKTITTLQPVESDAVPSCHRVAAEFVVLDFKSIAVLALIWIIMSEWKLT